MKDNRSVDRILEAWQEDPRPFTEDLEMNELKKTNAHEYKPLGVIEEYLTWAVDYIASNLPEEIAGGKKFKSSMKGTGIIRLKLPHNHRVAAEWTWNRTTPVSFEIVITGVGTYRGTLGIEDVPDDILRDFVHWYEEQDQTGLSQG